MVPWLCPCVCVNSCRSLGVLCVCWALCLSVSVDERVKHMCLCGGCPFWCRSLRCFVLFYTEEVVCVVCCNLLWQILSALLSRVSYQFPNLFIYVCVYTVSVMCFAWGSICMLVAWDAYDHLMAVRAAVNFLTFFCVFMRICDEVCRVLPAQLCLLRVGLKWRTELAQAPGAHSAQW